MTIASTVAKEINLLLPTTGWGIHLVGIITHWSTVAEIKEINLLPVWGINLLRDTTGDNIKEWKKKNNFQNDELGPSWIKRLAFKIYELPKKFLK